MEIINIDLIRLRGEECFGFMQRVHALSVASLTGEAELAALAPLGTAVEALDEALQQSKKNPHTEAMTEADRAAETAFCVARAYLSPCRAIRTRSSPPWPEMPGWIRLPSTTTCPLWAQRRSMATTTPC